MPPQTKASKLLVVSRGARASNAEVESALRSEFAGYAVVEFDTDVDYAKLVERNGPVVVAGGDGTVGHVIRALADTDHPLGIIPLGTFNNFARGLGLPLDVGGAVRVVKEGRSRSITLGRVNGHVFLEACAIGLFGDAIALGDRAKDLELGMTVEKVKDVAAAEPFEYVVTGDLERKGTAMSLVFSNTSSIGSQLPVSDATPIDPYLEFAVDAGRSVTDIVGRALASAILDKHEEKASDRLIRFRKLRVRTSPPVRVYADIRPVGRTPCVVTAEVSALRVLLPA